MKLRAVVFTVLILSLCLPMFGQSGGPIEQPDYRKWDASASTGVFALHRENSEYEEWEWQGAAWNLDAGRYLTTHLKAEAGVMWTPSYWRYSESRYNQRTRIRPFHVSTAVTYQFLENVYAHPYVSMGVRTTVQSEESQFCACNPTSGFSFVTTAREQSVRTRPFVAAGFKSYFNERVYLRPELMFTVGSHGISHSTIRFCVGFDF
jgi:hypothetical protein